MIKSVLSFLKGVKKVKTKSTAVSEVQYKNGTMIVEFRATRKKYAYKDVDKKHFERIKALNKTDGSVGAYVAKVIKPKHKVEKVED